MTQTLRDRRARRQARATMRKDTPGCESRSSFAETHIRVKAEVHRGASVAAIHDLTQVNLIMNSAAGGGVAYPALNFFFDRPHKSRVGDGRAAAANVSP